MNKKMRKIDSWKNELNKHKRLILFSILFLIVSLILNYFAGNYVSGTIGAVAPDLILDHLPTLDLDIIFIYGAVLVIAILFIYPLFFKVHELHKVISQFSLLVMIRSIFICFTHLQLPLNALKFKVPFLLPFLSLQNDLFFSGHTAFPFLGFLLFKGKIRYFFLASSLVMGAVVLFMHVHYTIDVLSAFFITYGSFKIGEWFFNKVNHYND